MRLRDRFRKRLYSDVVRRHPEVRTIERVLISQKKSLEFAEEKVNDLHADAIEARWDAQAMYDHAQEVVAIVRMYQRSLTTLAAPDPHASRVKVVIDNFYQQFKDRYDRHDG